MKNYEMIIKLLGKWPIDKSKGTRCFGNHLRELARKSFPSGNMFTGGETENRKKLESLFRLASNKYGEQYGYRKDTGASGYKYDYITKLLSDEFATRGFTKIGG